MYCFLFYIISLYLIFLPSQIESVAIPLNNKAYTLIDYSHHETCYEMMPFFMSMYDTDRARELISPVNKQTLSFNQQGIGDINPTWLNLISNNNLANYNSEVTLTPQLRQAGFLVQYYNKQDQFFIDIRSAFVQCTTQITIDEHGGGNGAEPGIANVAQAFEQSSWDYGKMGSVQHKEGIEEIHIRLGIATKIPGSLYSYFIGFLLIEPPTGTGTQSNYIFEPQVGNNHWAVGLGLQYMKSRDDFKWIFGSNWQYIAPAWEQRLFNLKNNGPWSCYLSLQDMYGLPTAPTTSGTPGVNILTQSSKILGRNEFKFYMRCKKFVKERCSFEVDYNYTFKQAETIGTITPLPTGYGIYALTGGAGGSGGVTTASQARINEDLPSLDPINYPVMLTTNDLDKQSAAAGIYASSTITFSMLQEEKDFKYGFGVSAEIGQTASSLSSWSIWTKFEFLLE